jgi:hypothetical protein
MRVCSNQVSLYQYRGQASIFILADMVHSRYIYHDTIINTGYWCGVADVEVEVELIVTFFNIPMLGNNLGAF